MVRNLAVEITHEHALKAAEAARCAREQGKFWEMHSRLFANQDALTLNDLLLHGQALKLDLPKFQKCLESGDYVSEIRKNKADGINAGMVITPTFFLGLTEPTESKVRVLKVIKGAQPYASFKETIEDLLSSQK